MTVREFVDGFKAADDKVEYTKGHIRRRYIPIREKMQLADQVARATYMISGKFAPHTVLGELMFDLAAFEAYTDIVVERIDKDGNVKTAEAYDDIVESGALDAVKKIVYQDWSDFSQCYWVTVEDIKAAETDTWAVIERQGKAFTEALKIIGKNFADVMFEHMTPEQVEEMIGTIKNGVRV